MQVHRTNVIDEAQCDDTVREWRWPEGRQCPWCDSKRVMKRGCDDKEPARQRYACNVCEKRFEDLTGPIFAGHHQPRKVWIVCLYVMGLNVSNEHMAKELDLDHSDVHQMTTDVREGIVKKSLMSRYLER